MGDVQSRAKSRTREKPGRPAAKIPDRGIFADLYSTDVIRIWEVDCLPGLYAFPEEPEPPKCKECLLDIVRGILEENGVRVRRYFLDHGTHNHWTPHDERWGASSCFK